MLLLQQDQIMRLHEAAISPRDPKAWESVKRYDGNHSHFDNATEKRIQPHVHDPAAPGGVRSPEPWETPR